MFVILLANGCNGKAQVKQEDKIMDDKAEIYLAGGCFWGMEHFCKQINGVTDTQVGFANGHTARPSYQQVCNDNTGHVWGLLFSLLRNKFRFILQSDN